MKFPDGLVLWFSRGDRGISSNTMVEVFQQFDEGMLTGIAGRSHPHDPADFNRCVKLLEAVPDYKSRLEELNVLGPVWSALVDHWDELTAMLKADEATGKSDALYDRMQEIIREAGGVF